MNDKYLTLKEASEFLKSRGIIMSRAALMSQINYGAFWAEINHGDKPEFKGKRIGTYIVKKSTLVRWMNKRLRGEITTARGKVVAPMRKPKMLPEAKKKSKMLCVKEPVEKVIINTSKPVTIDGVYTNKFKNMQVLPYYGKCEGDIEKEVFHVKPRKDIDYNYVEGKIIARYFNDLPAHEVRNIKLAMMLIEDEIKRIEGE